MENGAREVKAQILKILRDIDKEEIDPYRAWDRIKEEIERLCLDI